MQNGRRFLSRRSFLTALGAVGCSNVAGCAALFLPIIEFQDFEKPYVNTARGRLRVGLEPERSLQQRDGRDVRVYGKPYRFNAQYTTGDRALALYRGELRNITIRSVRTAQIVFSAAVLHDVHKQLRDAGKDNNNTVSLLGFGQGDLDIAYEDYAVALDYVIYDADSAVYDQGRAELVVKTDFYRARNRRGTLIL